MSVINLEKGARINLSKPQGGELTKIRMGLGWDPAKKGFFSSGSIDLDASCLMLNSNLEMEENIYFGNLRSRCASVQHEGDNLTGDGDGDDEVIRVDLEKVPANVHHLVFTVNSYRGQSFNDVANASCRLYDDLTGKVVAEYNLTEQGPQTGLVMVSLYRHNNTWKLKALGDLGNGRMGSEMLDQIRQLV